MRAMEQARSSDVRASQDALGNPITDDADQAFAAIVASIDGLDALGLKDERGRAIVEPASVFHWS
jgi:hypothetical protein